MYVIHNRHTMCTYKKIVHTRVHTKYTHAVLSIAKLKNAFPTDSNLKKKDTFSTARNMYKIVSSARNMKEENQKSFLITKFRSNLALQL